MVGKDLIKAAEIRNIVSGYETVQASINTFKLKFNCLPGDCPNATDYGFIGNGNGNGKIDGAWGTNGESGWIRGHLFDSNLIPKTLYSGTGWNPYLAAGYNDSWALFYDGDYWVGTNKTGMTLSWSSYCAPWGVKGSALSPNDASAIDTKIDDGLPASGRYFSFDAPPRVAVGGAGTCSPNLICRVSGQNSYSNSDIMSCRTVYYLQTN